MTRTQRLYRLFSAEVCGKYSSDDEKEDICGKCPYKGNPTCRKEPKDYTVKDVQFMMDAVYGARDNK